MAGATASIHSRASAQRHSVSQFRVHAREPGLYDGGRIVFAQGARHLKGKPQPALRVAVDLAAGDPAINSARVLDAADIAVSFRPTISTSFSTTFDAGSRSASRWANRSGLGKDVVAK